jgi:manganese/iron transport system permease protein
MEFLDILRDLFYAPISQPFMQRAILAAIMIGLTSGVMGAYVITRGMAFLGDALAHTVMPGVAVAFLLGGNNQQSLTLGGMIAGVLSALGVGFLTRGKRVSEDTAIGIVFAGMLALGIGIISKIRTLTDLAHILVGNVLAVRTEDLLLIFLVSGIVLAVITLLYKEFLIISFDQTLAQTLRLPGEALRMILLVLLAMTIVIGVQVVGVALMAAMVVTPAATARFFVQRLHHLMLLAGGIGSVSSIMGMYLAWHLEVTASTTIVLTMTVLFIIAFFFAPGKGYLWALLGHTAKQA